MFKIYLLLLTALLFSSYAKSQNNINNGKFVGGPCEGCNAIYEYGNRTLYPVDTLAGFNSSVFWISASVSWDVSISLWNGGGQRYQIFATT